MARVKLFINGVVKTVLYAELEKSGERAIDQIKIQLPPNASADVNDKIHLVQDFLDLKNLNLGCLQRHIMVR